MIDLTASDYNLQRLDTKEFLAHIKASIEAHSNIAGFGQRGIGKTSIIRQATSAINHLLVYFNLSLCERPDIGGYPNVFNSPDEFVHVLFPHKYRSLIKGDTPCVLVLDELDKADSSLNAPLLELIEDHALNGTPFPNLVSVISTGNLISEGGSRPIPPLLDRTEAYFVEATVEAWQEWAGTPEARIHPSVVSFIHDHPNQLIGAVDHPTYYKSPSPRSWHKVSNIAHFAETNSWDIDLINQKASGFVGKEAGIAFQLYFKQYKRLLPLVDGVFNERDYKAAFNSLEPNEKLYVAMIVSSRFATILDAHNPLEPHSPAIKKAMKASGGFYNRLYDAHPEYFLICLTNQIGVNRLMQWKLDEVSEWKDVVPALNSMSKGK